jgi:HSP20 family protein
MDLVRWGNGLSDPFLEFETLQDEINRLFDGARVAEPRGLFERTFSPAIDILESDDKFDVLCDMPGIEIKDIEISIAGNVLTIKGERRADGKSGNGNVYKTDTRLGRFQRTVQLPLPVDPDHVDAVLKDGVLKIALPKKEELKPRQISVKAK